MASVIGQLGNVITRRCEIDDDLAAVTSTTVAPTSEPAALVWDRIEALYRSGMHPGIELCIRHNGTVEIDRAIGHGRGKRPGRTSEPLVAMNTSTPVNLFSAAKAVSAMAMHKLEEQGLLDLDDPVADHLSGFERHGKHDVTIRHVLSHRAGLPGMPRESFDLDLLMDTDHIDEMLRDLELEREPGGGPPKYHAIIGGFVLDAVARSVVDGGLRAVIENEIRQPFGLDWFHLGVATDDADLVAHNIATGLRLDPTLILFFRRVLGTDWSAIIDLSNDDRYISGVIPSGNLLTTAADTAAFYQCLLNGGELDGTRVFEPETVAAAIAPLDEGMTVDRRIGLPIRYSSGFMLGTDSLSIFGWNHPNAFGHIGLSNVFTWADPDRDLVVALLTTGKPVLGTHLAAFPQLIAGIHEVYPTQ
jgi:CubicO group peptidase (beta-lactamase class C family)